MLMKLHFEPKEKTGKRTMINGLNLPPEIYEKIEGELYTTLP